MLLQEIENRGALQLKARQFKTLPGEAFVKGKLHLRFEKKKSTEWNPVSGRAYESEGLQSGMLFRNSREHSVLCVQSWLWFLWNNPAIGEVHFGLNTTQWVAESTETAGLLDHGWRYAGKDHGSVRGYDRKSSYDAGYGLRFWQCKLRYCNQEQVLDIAKEYKA